MTQQTTRVLADEYEHDDRASGASLGKGGNYKGAHAIVGFSVLPSLDDDGNPRLGDDGQVLRPRLETHLVSKNNKPWSIRHSGYPRPGESMPIFSGVGQFYHELRYTVIGLPDEDGTPTSGLPLYKAGAQGDAHTTMLADMNASWVGFVVDFEEFGVTADVRVLDDDGKPLKDEAGDYITEEKEFPEWAPVFKGKEGSRTLRRFVRPIRVVKRLSDEELSALQDIAFGVATTDTPEEPAAEEGDADVLGALLTLMAGKTKEQVLKQAAVLDQFEGYDLEETIDALLADETVTLTKSGTFKVLTTPEQVEVAAVR